MAINICWFNNNLRLGDNPALSAASKLGWVLPVFIYDREVFGGLELGAASRTWLHHSLTELDRQLRNTLLIKVGSARASLAVIVRSYKVSNIFWNRSYTPAERKQEAEARKELEKLGVKCRSFNGTLLWEPLEILKNDGSKFKTFSSFYKNGCLNSEAPRRPLPEPSCLNLVPRSASELAITDLALLPTHSWGQKIASNWGIGEVSAKKQLNLFLENGINNYKTDRNFPAATSVSRLSPHLRFGELSPNQIWYSFESYNESKDIYHFSSELGWREFSYYLLAHNPNLPKTNLQSKFDDFAWRDNKSDLIKWQQGCTGIPIVDAGMRELWYTGYMHNRLRMIVGSFLCKNLRLHWSHGARWFWNCLFDADLANNSAGWQWIAGCGADAAAYFRIFNPVLQGKKFDPNGDYTRKYVPELARLPNNFLFEPWSMPKSLIAETGVKLDEDYPKPMIDLKISAQRAKYLFNLL